MLCVYLFLQVMSHTLQGHAEDRFHKLNYSPVCFGAKDDQFGSFYTEAGKLAAIKLVYLYGYVSCHTATTSKWSYWGCGITKKGFKDAVNVVITTSGNDIIFPPEQFIIKAATKWYEIPGYNSLSPELDLTAFDKPYDLTSRQELMVKYGQDMVNQSEEDNGGKVCCDVYALYV